VDTGGTFTDVVRIGAGGLQVFKLRTTPDDPSRAIVDGTVRLAPEADGREVVHGSTIATNAVLERKGARVAFITTAGFEDVLTIGRQTRSRLYDVFVPLPAVLADPELTFGIHERLDASGRVLDPLDPVEVRRLARAIRDRGADIVAVCLLHAYANPEHERQVAEGLAAAGCAVTTSHQVLPEHREYERAATTVVNAYVTPLMDRYLAALASALGGSRLWVMQSNGGVLSASAARAQAVRTVLSGPAAGVVGAAAVARRAGFNRVIAFDMGGTSTDVSLVDGRIGTTHDSKVGDFPVRLPMVDIHTVGAGGGSIAHIDAGGALRVGPDSAGAVPGPACYGDGDRMTVTDANVLLGRLDPDLFLGGRMTLDVDRARRVAKAFARRLRLPMTELCEGIVRVADANMERAIRVVSIERGHDPRLFALVAFGGAGGMHAAALAVRLSIRTVLVPKHAGVLSALGMLLADVTSDYAASVLGRVAATDGRGLRAVFAPLVRTANRDLAAQGFAARRRRIERFVDIRYAGQSYELTVPFTPGLGERFDALHQRRYGYASPGRPIEAVAVRVRATGLTGKPDLPTSRVRRHRPLAFGRQPAHFDGRDTTTAVYRWADLEPGATAAGPAVIAGAEATAVVPPGFRFRLDAFGNVLIEIGRSATSARRSR